MAGEKPIRGKEKGLFFTEKKGKSPKDWEKKEKARDVHYEKYTMLVWQHKGKNHVGDSGDIDREKTIV